jgi:MFS family permease
MWELYAMWSLISLYFFDYFIGSGDVTAAATRASGVAAFSVIAAGAVGCVLAGRWADVIGRERVTIYAMGVSGMCALLMGHLLGFSLWVVAPVALVWGFSVVADSAQFSAIVTEVAPPHAVGTALTLQTSIGFLLTAVAIPVTIMASKWLGWAAAFSLLAVGPVFGIIAMWRLKQARQ